MVQLHSGWSETQPLRRSDHVVIANHHAHVFRTRQHKKSLLQIAQGTCYVQTTAGRFPLRNWICARCHKLLLLAGLTLATTVSLVAQANVRAGATLLRFTQGNPVQLQLSCNHRSRDMPK